MPDTSLLQALWYARYMTAKAIRAAKAEGTTTGEERK